MEAWNGCPFMWRTACRAPHPTPPLTHFQLQHPCKPQKFPSLPWPTGLQKVSSSSLKSRKRIRHQHQLWVVVVEEVEERRRWERRECSQGGALTACHKRHHSGGQGHWDPKPSAMHVV
ncbi:hypothetical protein B296_00046175 [Ensete ventricosum]|uniref:Uncharacterized protein n=1 Tax=Ensete ventricosum TaxID=4639 RepID=A0A426Z4W3_ENSVE|nr:hypothetical protein B296_00046175 [Ensete ventricosum]